MKSAPNLHLCPEPSRTLLHCLEGVSCKALQCQCSSLSTDSARSCFRTHATEWMPLLGRTCKFVVLPHPPAESPSILRAAISRQKQFCCPSQFEGSTAHGIGVGHQVGSVPLPTCFAADAGDFLPGRERYTRWVRRREVSIP